MLIKVRGKGHRELVIADPGSSLHSHDYTGDHWPFSWHHHPEIELTLIERGSGVRAVGESVESYGPGDVVLIGSGVPHSWSSRPGAAGGVHSVVVQFPPVLLATLTEAERLAGILELARLGLRGPPEAAALVRAVHAAGDPVLRVSRLLEALVGATSWQPLARIPPRTRRHDPRLDRAVAFLHQHAREPIELAALATRVSMLPPALSRSFRSAFGTTAGEYLARLRIGLCCQDLAGGTAEVAAIAFANGFGNLPSFHRWFRRVTGTTPERWRKRISAG